MKRCIIVIMLAAVLAPSCLRRELDIESDAMRVILENDFSAPLGGGIPVTESKGYHAIPYHFEIGAYDAAGNLAYQDFCDTYGGIIHGEPGRYDMYACSLDGYAIDFDGQESLSTYHVAGREADSETKRMFLVCRDAAGRDTLSDRSPVRTKSETGLLDDDNVLVIKEPDGVYAGVLEDLDIPIMTVSDDMFTFTMQTRFAICRGKIIVTGITHADYLGSVQVYLTGLAAGRRLVEGIPDEKMAVQSFYADTIAESRIVGVFNHLGVPEGEGEPMVAYILLSDTNDGKYLFSANVTAQVLSQGEDFVVEINVPFDVPEPKVGGGGFQPTVGDWDVVLVEVPLGKLPE